MDIVSREKRSQMMASVRSKNTKPEVIVRSYLHAIGYRFRLHRKDLPGNPDIILPKYKKIIFVHGCFWHQHKNCPKAKRPDTRKEFWNKKLNENVTRDKRHIQEIVELGWSPYVIWECQTLRTEDLKAAIDKIFNNTL